jgi:hypothetical protein
VFLFFGVALPIVKRVHIGIGFVLDPSLGMFVCLFAGWLSAHWEEITHLCVRFGSSLFGSGHWEETKERQLGPLLQLFGLLALFIWEEIIVMLWCKIWAPNFCSNFTPCRDSHITIWPLHFPLNLTLCVVHMDGWPCSSNLSQHLLSQFNHTIFLEKKWMG